MDEANLAKMTTILSIALVTILGLLVLNLIKIRALKKENETLKKQIEDQ